MAAQRLLGLAYEKGQGVTSDQIEAMAWLYIAAASGDADAKNEVSNLETELGEQTSLDARLRQKQILQDMKSGLIGSPTPGSKN